MKFDYYEYAMSFYKNANRFSSDPEKTMLEIKKTIFQTTWFNKKIKKERDNGWVKMTNMYNNLFQDF